MNEKFRKNNLLLSDIHNGIYKKDISGRQINIRNTILSILSISSFNPFLFNLLYNTSDTSFYDLRIVLSALNKKGACSNITMGTYDVFIRKLYFGTKKGVEQAGDISLLSYSGNLNKFLKHTERLAFHDFGISICSLALIYSPFEIKEIDYEKSFMLDSNVAVPGRDMARAHKPDAAYLLSSGRFDFNLYLEHDTKSEPVRMLFDKLKEYALHELLNTKRNGNVMDSIFITSHVAIEELPFCFNQREVRKLLSYMKDGNTAQMVLSEMDTAWSRKMSSAFSRCTSLDLWECFGDELESYHDELVHNTNKHLLRYARQRQRKSILDRRMELEKKLLSYLHKALTRKSLDNYGVLNPLAFHGFSVPYIASCDMDLTLPFLYPFSYPNEMDYMGVVLSKNFHKTIQFTRSFCDITLKYDNRAYLFVLKNQFSISGSAASIYVESASDLGAVLRAKLFLMDSSMVRQSEFFILEVDCLDESDALRNLIIDGKTPLSYSLDDFNSRNRFVLFLLRNEDTVFFYDNYGNVHSLKEVSSIRL